MAMEPEQWSLLSEGARWGEYLDACRDLMFALDEKEALQEENNRLQELLRERPRTACSATEAAKPEKVYRKLEKRIKALQEINSILRILLKREGQEPSCVSAKPFDPSSLSFGDAIAVLQYYRDQMGIR